MDSLESGKVVMSGNDKGKGTKRGVKKGHDDETKGSNLLAVLKATTATPPSHQGTKTVGLSFFSTYPLLLLL